MIPLSPIGHHSLFLFLVQLSILLSAALLLGAVARKHKLPSIVGELGAGILLGPSFFGFFFSDLFSLIFPPIPEQFHLLDAVGQVGLIMLVGLSGMEINTKLLKRYGTTAIRISLGGLLVPFAFGMITGYLLPETLFSQQTDRFIFALFLGVALCVSAIPVIAKTLMDLKLTNHRVGQFALTAGIVDDVIGWVILSIIVALVNTGRVDPFTVTSSILSVGLFLIFAFTIGRRIVHYILQLVRKNSTDNGPVVTAMTVMILLSAAITHAMNMESVFGAFICGILIRTDKNFRHISLPTILSVLAPLFFATVGLRVNLVSLADPFIFMSAIAVLFVAFAGKFIGAFIGGRLSGLDERESLALGAAMNARGVIEIVIANIGMRLGVLGMETYTIIVLVAVITSLAAPPLLRILLETEKHSTRRITT